MGHETPEPSLETRIGDLVLKNPVMTASGTFGYGAEFAPYVDLNDLGAIVVKGISLEPRSGNPPPRTAETPCGMVNAIGLENVGLERFLSDKLPYLGKFDVPVVVNVLGRRVDDYVRLAGELSRAGGVSAVELNVSCPNVKSGGQAFGMDPEAVKNVGERRAARCIDTRVGQTESPGNGYCAHGPGRRRGGRGRRVCGQYLPRAGH